MWFPILDDVTDESVPDGYFTDDSIINDYFVNDVDELLALTVNELMENDDMQAFAVTFMAMQQTKSRGGGK